MVTKPIKNSLQNWPIQSTGSDVLRMAMLDVQEQGFKVCALVHDAILWSCRLVMKETLNRCKDNGTCCTKNNWHSIRVDCKEMKLQTEKEKSATVRNYFPKIREYKNNKASPIGMYASRSKWCLYVYIIFFFINII